jgi:predicted dehydrogenase
MPLNLALVGLKGHWHAIAEELRALPQVRWVAVADDSPEMLARVPDFPGATPDTHAYLDFRDLLAKEKVDIVVEAGNDRDRAGIVLACAERGIHIIAEKPLVKDLPDLEKVQAAVAGAGITATMLLTMRCLPTFLAMRQAIAEGRIGQVCQAGAQKSYKLGERPRWQKTRETFSGIIPFVGIHALDLVRWTSGREFVEVMAYQSNAGHPEVGELEDNACVIAKLDNGASAAIRLDYCRPAAAPTHGDDRVRIAGNRGVIECIGDRTVLITHGDGPRALPLPPPVAFFTDYVRALEQQRPPFISFAECVRITEVALRAREAAETGRPVKIPGS